MTRPKQHDWLTNPPLCRVGELMTRMVKPMPNWKGKHTMGNLANSKKSFEHPTSRTEPRSKQSAPFATNAQALDPSIPTRIGCSIAEELHWSLVLGHIAAAPEWGSNSTHSSHAAPQLPWIAKPSSWKKPVCPSRASIDPGMWEP